MANHNHKTAATLVKAGHTSSAIVAVIASPADLAVALHLRSWPDFLELRLDAFIHDLDQLESSLHDLRAPLIITARHSAEGGITRLSDAARQRLLLRFLPRAAFVDVELRSLRPLKAVIDAAQASSVGRILSVHALAHCPAQKQLHEWAETARSSGADVCKIALRTDTIDELRRLLAFWEEESEGEMPISAMSIGRYGRASRVALARGGSALSYVHLGDTRLRLPGQLSLTEMRRVLSAHARHQPATEVRAISLREPLV